MSFAPSLASSRFVLVGALAACAAGGAPPTAQPTAIAQAPASTGDTSDAGRPPRDSTQVDARAPESAAETSDAGRSTDGYVAEFASFLRERLPSMSGQARKLCVTYQLRLDRRMIPWHVGSAPVQASGDASFDEQVRAMLQRLVDEGTALPEPPPALADQFRARTIVVAIGEGCR